MSKLNLDLEWIKEVVRALNNIFLAMKDRSVRELYGFGRSPFPLKKLPKDQYISIIEDLQSLTAMYILDDLMKKIDKDIKVDPLVLQQEIAVVRAFFLDAYRKNHPDFIKLPDSFEALMTTEVDESAILTDLGLSIKNS